MATAPEPVQLERAGAIATIRFNRPEVLNALDEAGALSFLAAVETVASDPDMRVVVIAGQGRAFMAGGDLGRFHAELDHADQVADAIIGPFHRALTLLQSLPVPTIASVQGAAAGAGMSLAMATDLCIAADSAKFSLAYARIGTSPDGSSTWYLPRLVGLRKAMEIALLADTIDAAEALRLSLVNFVVPAADLATETARLAQRLVSGPTLAYGRIKALLQASGQRSLPDQLRAEQESFAASAGTEDFRAGVTAFVTKQPAVFHGR